MHTELKSIVPFHAALMRSLIVDTVDEWNKKSWGSRVKLREGLLLREKEEHDKYENQTVPVELSHFASINGVYVLFQIDTWNGESCDGSGAKLDGHFSRVQCLLSSRSSRGSKCSFNLSLTRALFVHWWHYIMKGMVC